MFIIDYQFPAEAKSGILIGMNVAMHILVFINFMLCYGHSYIVNPYPTIIKKN